MSVLVNPPMPDWNDLSNEEKMAIDTSWETHSCPHSCGGSVTYVYDAIREALRERERRYFNATMAGPPADHFADGQPRDRK